MFMLIAFPHLSWLLCSIFP